MYVVAEHGVGLDLHVIQLAIYTCHISKLFHIVHGELFKDNRAPVLMYVVAEHSVRLDLNIYIRHISKLFHNRTITTATIKQLLTRTIIFS